MNKRILTSATATLGPAPTGHPLRGAIVVARAAVAVAVTLLAVGCGGAAQTDSNEPELLLWGESPLSAGAALQAMAVFGANAGEVRTVLTCPRRRSPPGTLDLERWDCRFDHTETLELGDVELRVGVITSSWDLDGLHGDSQGVVVFDESDGAVIHVFLEWELDNDDPDASFRFRRAAEALDERGAPIVCIEEVHEVGPGASQSLPTVDGESIWTPRERERTVTAWRGDGVGFTPAPDANRACPDAGYERITTFGQPGGGFEL